MCECSMLCPCPAARNVLSACVTLPCLLLLMSIQQMLWVWLIEQSEHCSLSRLCSKLLAATSSCLCVVLLSSAPGQQWLGVLIELSFSNCEQTLLLAPGQRQISCFQWSSFSNCEQALVIAPVWTPAGGFECNFLQACEISRFIGWSLSANMSRLCSWLDTCRCFSSVVFTASWSLPFVLGTSSVQRAALSFWLNR